MGIDEMLEALAKATGLEVWLEGLVGGRSVEDIERFFESLPPALWTVLGILAALFLLFEIVSPIAVLIGRYCAFKSAGLGGWRGAIPLYSWFVIGIGRGSVPLAFVGLFASLCHALGFAESDVHFEVFLIALVLEFLLLKCPMRKGGLSVGRTLGLVLLPCVFWFVVAHDGSFARAMRAGMDDDAPDELIPVRPQPRLALMFLVVGVVGLRVLLGISDAADSMRRKSESANEASASFGVSDGQSHVADIELLRAETIEVREADTQALALKVYYRATNVSDQTISTAYDVRALIDAYVDGNELDKLTDYFTEDDYIFDEDDTIKLASGATIEGWLVFTPVEAGDGVSVCVLDYLYEGDVVAQNTYVVGADAA